MIKKNNNPPTPIPISGLNRSTIQNDFTKLVRSLKGNSKFLGLFKFRSIPLIHKPLILYPAFGTRSISIFHLAPTNKIAVLGSFSLNFSAIAIAGNKWPPVPPPLISTFIIRIRLFTILIRLFYVFANT